MKFWKRGFSSLFTNLSVDTVDKNDIKSDMGYFMLDLLFLLGDPKQSQTLIDIGALDG